MLQWKQGGAFRTGYPHTAGTHAQVMDDAPSRRNEVIRVRFTKEERDRLKQYADEIGLGGISSGVRVLALELLALKERQMAAERQRRTASEEALRRQLGE